MITPEKLMQAAAEASGELAAVTPAMAVGSGKLPGARLSFEDSAGPRRVCNTDQLSLAVSPPNVSGDGWQQQSPTSPAALSAALGGSSSAASGATQSTQSTPFAASPGILSSTHTPSPGDACGRDLESAAPCLSRQSTFSQPYFAELEGEAEAEVRAAAAAGLVTPSAASAGEVVPPHALPAGRCRADSGSTRAAQLLAAQEQMTAEELHEVRAAACAARCGALGWPGHLLSPLAAHKPCTKRCIAVHSA